MSRIRRQLLRDLAIAEDGLYPFTIHRRYKLTATEISKELRFLIEHQLVALDANRVMLTKHGQEWVKKSRLHLLQAQGKPWRQCPEEFRREAVSINRPYVPRLELLDIRSFPHAHQLLKVK